MPHLCQTHPLSIGGCYPTQANSDPLGSLAGLSRYMNNWIESAGRSSSADSPSLLVKCGVPVRMDSVVTHNRERSGGFAGERVKTKKSLVVNRLLSQQSYLLTLKEIPVKCRCPCLRNSVWLGRWFPVPSLSTNTCSVNLHLKWFTLVDWAHRTCLFSNVLSTNRKSLCLGLTLIF